MRVRAWKWLHMYVCMCGGGFIRVCAWGGWLYRCVRVEVSVHTYGVAVHVCACVRWPHVCVHVWGGSTCVCARGSGFICLCAHVGVAVHVCACMSGLTCLCARLGVALRARTCAEVALHTHEVAWHIRVHAWEGLHVPVRAWGGSTRVCLRAWWWFYRRVHT